MGLASRRSRRFLRDSTGHFAIMTAFMTPVAIMLAAFAVDVGSLHVEKRRAQALTDLAALSAAANLDKAEQAALLSMADNGVGKLVLGAVTPGEASSSDAGSDDRIVVVRGRYVADPAVEPADRFVPGGMPFNAAKVSYRTTGTRYFSGAIIPPPPITASALASASAAAAFSVGSRLAALDGGIANALLGKLTGSTISLSVMDYNALLDADVDLLHFLDVLALDLNLSAASYSQVLASEITFSQLAKALSKTNGPDGNGRAALSKLAQHANSANAPRFTLSKLIGLGDAGSQLAAVSIDQIAAQIGVMELLTTSAIVAGKGRQIALDLGANVPGLASVSVNLAVGEPPQTSQWFRIGAGGELVRTAQTRLAITAEIGELLGARVRVPLYLELAFAEARLKSISCPGGRAGDVEVGVEARPGIANLYLAEVDPGKIAGFANPAPRSPARVLQVPLLVTVTGQAQAEIANMTPKLLTFSASDIANARVKQVSTQQITGSLTRSLFSSLRLDVNVLGLGIGIPGNLTGTVGNLLNAATPALDAVLANLLSTLGLSLGQADIRVHSAICGRPALVQ